MYPATVQYPSTKGSLGNYMELSLGASLGVSYSAAETSHLRLASAQSIVRLTHMKPYENELTVSKFEHLGLTLQVCSL